MVNKFIIKQIAKAYKLRNFCNISGHADVIMGAVALNDDELFNRLKFLQNCMLLNKMKHA